MTGNDDSCGDSSEVTWDSSLGTDYFIFLHGRDGATGSYEISFTGLRPAEVGCSSAEDVDVGTTIFGSTVGQPVYIGLSCNISVTDSAGVWYRIIGTGLMITVGTCGGGTSFDTMVRLCLVHLPFALFLAWLSVRLTNNHVWSLVHRLESGQGPAISFLV